MPSITHAIVLADTYSPFLDPIVRDTPALLLKIGGVYLLDILIHRLCTGGIDSITIVANSHVQRLQTYIDEDCCWSPKFRTPSAQTFQEPRNGSAEIGPPLTNPESISIRVVSSNGRNIYSALRDVFRSLPDFSRSYGTQFGTSAPQFLLVDGPAITNLNFSKAFAYHETLTNIHSKEGNDYILTAILSIHTETSSLRPLVAPSIIIRDPETCELKNLIVDATTSNALVDLEIPFEEKCYMHISSNLYLTGFYVISLNFLKFFSDNDSFKDTESMHTFLSSVLDTSGNYSIKMGSYLLENCEVAVTVDSPRLYQEVNRAYIKGYFRPYSPEANFIHYKGIKTQFRSISDWTTIGAMQLQSCGTLYCDESTFIPPTTIIAGDSLVHRNCHLEGTLTLANSMLCDNVFIGSGSKIIDTIINSKALIGKGCVLRSCYIGSDVRIEDNISLPCGSMIGNGVVVTPEVLYQSIKMTFQAYFHCNFTAYLSFIVRYFLYLDDQMENALTNSGFIVGSPLPSFITEDDKVVKTIGNLLSSDQVEKLKLLQSHQNTIYRFFRNEVSYLPSAIIGRFIPPIFLAVTRPPPNVLLEYTTNTVQKSIFSDHSGSCSVEFDGFKAFRDAPTSVLNRNGSSRSLLSTSEFTPIVDYPFSVYLPPRQPSIDLFKSDTSSHELEQSSLLADMINGTVPITELPWPGVTQTTLNPLPNASKYDEFFKYLVDCAREEAQSNTDDDYLSAVIHNPIKLSGQMNILNFDETDNSEESGNSDEFVCITNSANGQDEEMTQKSKSISPKVLYSVKKDMDPPVHRLSCRQSSDYSTNSIKMSESKSIKSQQQSHTTELPLYTLPYYIVRSLSNLEDIADQSQSMRASFVGDILLEKLPEAYSDRLTTSLKYLMFSGFVFRPTFYAFFDSRKLSYMTLMGMDSLPASMCRPLPYIRHIASLKSIPQHKLSTFDIDEDLLETREEENQIKDIAGDEMRKQRSLAQFKETVRDLLLETFGSLFATAEIHHQKSKSLGNDLKQTEFDDDVMDGFSTTLSSTQLKEASRRIDTSTDISTELLMKLVTDFHTAVKVAEECKLNTNNQRALSILSQFIFLYVFMGSDLFGQLNPREHNYLPSNYCIEQKYFITLPDKESCSAHLYLQNSSNKEGNEILHMPPLSSTLKNFTQICNFFFKHGFKHSMFGFSGYDEEDESEEEFAFTFIEFIVLFFNESIKEVEIATYLVEFFMVLHDTGAVSGKTLSNCKRILSTSDDEIDMALHDNVFTKIVELCNSFGSFRKDSDSMSADLKVESTEESDEDEYEYYYSEDEDNI